MSITQGVNELTKGKKKRHDQWLLLIRLRFFFSIYLTATFWHLEESPILKQFLRTVQTFHQEASPTNERLLTVMSDKRKHNINNIIKTNYCDSVLSVLSVLSMSHHNCTVKLPPHHTFYLLILVVHQYSCWKFSYVAFSFLVSFCEQFEIVWRSHISITQGVNELTKEKEARLMIFIDKIKNIFNWFDCHTLAPWEKPKF